MPPPNLTLPTLVWVATQDRSAVMLCVVRVCVLCTVMGQPARHLARTYSGNQSIRLCFISLLHVKLLSPKGLILRRMQCFILRRTTAIGMCLARLHDCMRLLLACWAVQPVV